jgi:hypothetical protein
LPPADRLRKPEGAAGEGVNRWSTGSGRFLRGESPPYGGRGSGGISSSNTIP